MASSACCDAGQPVVTEYVKHGEHAKVDGIDVYVTGSGSRCILFVPDIFGFDFSQVRRSSRARQTTFSSNDVREVTLYVCSM